MSTGKIMRNRRKEIGISAEVVAEAIGVSPATIYRYENGDIEKVPGDLLAPLSEILQTTPAYLMGWEDNNPPGERGISSLGFDNVFPLKTKKIPLLGEIACGEPIYANEEHSMFVDANIDIKADFCLRAKGDSMVGARIYDGDIVFIRSQPMVEDGEIAAVIIGDEATLKRVYYDREDNEITLLADNPKYMPMHYRDSELNEIKIIGKAVAFQSYVV